MKTDVHLWSYLTKLPSEWEMFQTNVVGEIKTLILYPIIFFLENRAIYGKMGKNIEEPESDRRQTTL